MEASTAMPDFCSSASLSRPRRTTSARPYTCECRNSCARCALVPRAVPPARVLPPSPLPQLPKPPPTCMSAVTVMFEGGTPTACISANTISARRKSGDRVRLHSEMSELYVTLRGQGKRTGEGENSVAGLVRRWGQAELDHRGRRDRRNRRRRKERRKRRRRVGWEGRRLAAGVAGLPHLVWYDALRNHVVEDAPRVGHMARAEELRTRQLVRVHVEQSVVHRHITRRTLAPRQQLSEEALALPDLLGAATPLEQRRVDARVHRHAGQPHGVVVVEGRVQSAHLHARVDQRSVRVAQCRLTAGHVGGRPHGHVLVRGKVGNDGVTQPRIEQDRLHQCVL
eukprot:scaffold3942_cov123-Isochrysis_galbana.AAC.16